MDCSSLGCTYNSDIPVTGRKPVISGLIRDLILGLRSRLNAELCGIGAKASPGGRVRLGGDVLGYGGIGGGIGAGVHVTNEGRLGADFYYGWGAGIGGVAGVGLSNESSTPATGTTVTNSLVGSGGVLIAGGTISYSKSDVQYSSGVSVGPKLGLAGGSLKSTTHAFDLGNVCE